MKRGLLLGRFQPPHRGHLKMIQHILTEMDEIVIVVAAAQFSFSKKNPFTAGERLSMINAMLKEHGIDLGKVWLIPVQDVQDNDTWVPHLLRMCPDITEIYGNNPFTTLLFSNAGIKVKQTELFERDKFEARAVREQLLQGNMDNAILPKAVIEVLVTLDAVNRLQALYQNDSTTSKESSSEIK